MAHRQVGPQLDKLVQLAAENVTVLEESVALRRAALDAAERALQRAKGILREAEAKRKAGA